MAEVPQVTEVADRLVSTITTDPHLPETAEVAERPVSTITADTYFPARMAETAEVAERPVSTITTCYDFRRLDNRRQSKDQEFSSMSCSRMQVC